MEHTTEQERAEFCAIIKKHLTQYSSTRLCCHNSVPALQRCDFDEVAAEISADLRQAARRDPVAPTATQIAQHLWEKNCPLIPKEVQDPHRLMPHMNEWEVEKVLADAASAPVVPVPQQDLPEGPWSYRPHKYDDWGVVKDACGAVVCKARDTRALDDEALAAHRKAGTDPWEKVARFIVDARNAMLAAAPQPPEADHIPDAKKMAAAPGQLSELVRKLCISAKRDGELGRDSSRTKEIAQQLCQLIEPQSP